MLGLMRKQTICFNFESYKKKKIKNNYNILSKLGLLTVLYILETIRTEPFSIFHMLNDYAKNYNDNGHCERVNAEPIL